jgi:uncharacterized protein YjaZ
MTITMLNTAAGMASVLDAAEEDRAETLRAVLAPMAGMYRYFPGEVDLVQMHAMSFGFPLDRDEETVREALERLEAANAWERIEGALTDAVDVQARAVPGLVVPDLSVLLMLGDPGDDHFMTEIRGFSGNGSATGYIALTLWPTEENLSRLEASAVHELHHNLRYAPGGVIWDPATVTAGEQIVSEGLADAFARQLHGDERGYTPIGRAHLDDDAVFDRVVSGLDVGGMQHFAAWVLGDATAVRFGGEPVGLPTGAGYAVGNRLVDRYLRATRSTASDALHVPSREIIDIALDRN